MPLTPKDIITDGPDVFIYAITNTFGSPTGIDASPIYATIDASVVISGSFSGGAGTAWEDFTFTYDTTITANQATRITLRNPALDFVALENAMLPSYYGGFSYSDILVDGVAVGVDEFIATHGYMPTKSEKPITCPFSPPAFSTPLAGFDFTGGTSSDAGSDPPFEQDLYIEVTMKGPYMRGTIEDGDIEMYFRLEGSYESKPFDVVIDEEIVVDASGWGSPQFRDVRGTYNDTLTDANGVSFNFTFTIG